MGEGTVLLRRSSLGDVVLLGAVTSRVQGPVTVVTAPEWAPVAARLRGVDRVVSWPRRVPARDVAAAIPPGWWVDLQVSPRSLALCAAARRAPPRLRKHSLARRLRLAGVPVQPRPWVTSLYARACGVHAAPAPWIDLDREPEALVLFPGASRRTKRWAAERFAQVGRAWEGSVIVAGGPDDASLVAEVAAGVPGAESFAERGFVRTFAALARAAVAVGGDSGLIHVAGACGVPVVAVFGTTHPDDGFWVHRGEVVQRDLPCRPCSLHGRDDCPLGHTDCLDVPADDVTAAVQRCAG